MKLETLIQQPTFSYVFTPPLLLEERCPFSYTYFYHDLDVR